MRKQESILRRLIHSQKISPEDAKKMQIYLPRAQDVPIDYLDYDPKDKQTGSGIGNDSARYVEVGEPDSILTKLAAIRLHVNYGDHSNPDEPYSQRLDLNSKHEILA